MLTDASRWRQHCEISGMARPLRIHIPRAFYHVMSRGNAKQTIFVGEADYEVQPST